MRTSLTARSSSAALTSPSARTAPLRFAFLLAGCGRKPSRGLSRSAAPARVGRGMRCQRPSVLALGFHAGVLEDPGHRDDVVTADDERPRLALGSADLGVDEHVLSLLRAAGEAVSRPPAPYL